MCRVVHELSCKKTGVVPNVKNVLFILFISYDVHSFLQFIPFFSLSESLYFIDYFILEKNKWCMVQ